MDLSAGEASIISDSPLPFHMLRGSQEAVLGCGGVGVCGLQAGPAVDEPCGCEQVTLPRLFPPVSNGVARYLHHGLFCGDLERELTQIAMSNFMVCPFA